VAVVLRAQRAVRAGRLDAHSKTRRTRAHERGGPFRPGLRARARCRTVECRVDQ
jgi:hypothetical protein